MKKKIVFWTTGIDKLRDEQGIVGGLILQLSIWADIFQDNGWKTFTFTTSPTERKDLNYVKLSKFRVGNIFFEPIISLIHIIRIRPNLIVSRAARRNLVWISIWTRILGIKHIHMIASDSDLDFGNEIIKNHWDRKLYQIGMKLTKYFVAQNKLQASKLNLSFKRVNSIIIPNVWHNKDSKYENERETILWVSNIRSLKRPDWLLKLAKSLPNYNFVMVGGSLDDTLYEYCKNNSNSITNLQFKGSLSLSEVNIQFSQARMFLCTSTIEGFPNTFLQAWSNKIPVLTSFDPSGIVADYNLGIVCDDINSFIKGIKNLENKNLYQEIQTNITEYFAESHDAKKMYSKLVSSFLS